MGDRRRSVCDGRHRGRNARHLGCLADSSRKRVRLAIIRHFLGFRIPSGTLWASWSLFRRPDESFRRSANGDHRSIHHSVWSCRDHIREDGLAVLHFLGSAYRRGDRSHGDGAQRNRRHEMVRQASRTCDGDTVRATSGISTRYSSGSRVFSTIYGVPWIRTVSSSIFWSRSSVMGKPPIGSSSVC
jgi:hypothetical protein